MAIELKDVYQFDDVGGPEQPMLPGVKYLALTPQPNQATPGVFYRLSGWVVLPAGGLYQIRMISNFLGSLRLNGLVIGNGGSGFPSYFEYRVPSSAVVRIDLTYSTLFTGDSGYAGLIMIGPDGDITYSPDAGDFVGYTAGSVDEFIGEEFLPEEPIDPEGPDGPEPPGPWDGSFSTVYETYSYGAGASVPCHVLHLTEDPAAVPTFWPYRYKMAKWLTVPAQGVYTFTVAGGDGPFSLSINGQPIANGIMSGVIPVTYTALAPSVVRLDMQYHLLPTDTGANGTGYVGYVMRDADQNLIDESRAADFIGAIVTSDVEVIPDAALGPAPELPSDDDIRVAELALFTGRPNWRDGLSVFYDFLTDVRAAQEGWEQRASLRDKPRQRTEATFTEFFLQRQIGLNRKIALGFEAFMLPLWWTSTRTTAQTTAGLYVVPGDFRRSEYLPESTVLIQSGMFTERAIIESKTDTELTLRTPAKYSHAKGATVVALRRAQFRGGRGYRNVTSGVSEGRLQLHILETYANEGEWYGTDTIDEGTESLLPAMLYPPNLKAPTEIDAGTLQFEMDNGISNVHVVEPTGHVQTRSRFTYHCENVTDINAMLKVIHAMAGRRKTFFLPTYADDFYVSPDHVGSSEWLMVKGNGYMDVAAQPLSKYIMISFKRGKSYLRRIVFAQQIGEDVRLLLNLPIPKHQASDIKKVSFMWESRLDTDSIEFVYLTDSVCTVALTYKSFRNTILKIEPDAILPTYEPIYVMT